MAEKGPLYAHLRKDEEWAATAAPGPKTEAAARRGDVRLTPETGLNARVYEYTPYWIKSDTWYPNL
jgi:hypothetical protein